MTENQGGEAATVEDTATAQEAVVSSQEQGSARDYEAEAKEQGWRPQEEWKGAPESWKDAKTYVEHGEHITRVADARVAKVEKNLKDRFDKRLESLERVSAKAIENLKAQQARELADLRAAKKEAVKAGDVDEVDRLDDEIDALKHDTASASWLADDGLVKDDLSPKELEAFQKHNAKVQKEFMASQSWWDVDEEMTDFAIGRSQNLAGKNPRLPLEDNLRQTLEALRKKFPEKFTTKKSGANGHAPVDSGGDLSGSEPAKSALSGIPEADLAIGRRHVKEGLFKTLEAWAKEYHNA